MWFSAHRDKTNHKNPQKKLLDETNVSALRLRCYCHAKDRKPDAEMQFGANMCHWVFTCEKSPPHNPWMQFLLCEGPFTVWGSFEERCGGGGVATSQTSQNTYNKPWMFLIRLLFILTSAVSWLATIAVTFHHFFGYFFFFFWSFQSLSLPHRPRTHTLLLPGPFCSCKRSMFGHLSSAGPDWCCVGVALGHCYSDPCAVLGLGLVLAPSWSWRSTFKNP